MASESKESAEELTKIVFYATVLGALLYAAVVFIFIISPNEGHAPKGQSAAQSVSGKHD